jgi:hypothetical protein
MTLEEPAQFVSDDRLSEEDKTLVGELNASLDRLSGLRAAALSPGSKSQVQILPLRPLL